MKKKISTFDVVNIAILLLLSASILFPFINTIATSFSSSQDILLGRVLFLPSGFTLSSYEKLLNTSAFYNSVSMTAQISILGTALALFITTIAGFAFSRKMLGHKWLFLLVLICMFFNGGMIPTFLQIKRLGLYDTMWILVIFGSFGIFNMIVARNFFQQLPKEVFESGMIDGCNDLSLFFRIALPMSKPVVATLALFIVVQYWNTFMPGILYVQSPNLVPLQVYVRQMLQVMVQLDSVAAAAAQLDEANKNNLEGVRAAVIMLSTVPIICVYPLLQRYFVTGLNMGAVKG